MRWLLVIVALLASACGGSSVTPTPVPVPVPIPTPAPVPPPVTILITACPDVSPTPTLETGFFRAILCNGFSLPIQAMRRWIDAPKLYIRTIDDAGAPIDQVTLDTVANAMTETAIAWTAGKFGLAGIERGTETRANISGWVTVSWPATAAAAPSCGQADVARDGGTIELNYKVTACGCNGSAMRPRTARHELGHAFGYWHTDNANDLMAGLIVNGCDAGLSAREQLAAAYLYR